MPMVLPPGSRRALLPALLLLVGCKLDAGLNAKDAPRFDSGTEATDGDDTAITDLPAEECNGVDDDGDGEVDEGFADDDGNGRADCEDVACPDAEPMPGGNVDALATCERDDSSDPWNIGIEWRYGSGVGYGATNATATGYLTDDDGDGVLGSGGDIPEIVYSDWRKASSGEALTVLSGDGSGVEWVELGLESYDGVAVADVNGDGWTEVIAIEQGDRVAAWDHAGAIVWESDAFDLGWCEQIAVADLDADGLPEVIAGSAVLNGEDGSTVATLASDPYTYSSPVPGDIDLDGTQEIVFGPDVYDASGAVLWSATPDPRSDFFAALVQADGDPEAEVAFVSDSGYHLYDTDGTEIVSTSLPADNPASTPGPPCVADFDGDGTPELGVATINTLSVLELDGTVDWSFTTLDTGPTGCSAFDFDGDGAAELVANDLYAVYVLDGRTGAEDWSWRPGIQITNGQGSEYPYVADVDGDGDAEIVASTNNDPTQGVVVFGQVDGDWPGAGPTWGVHDFSETNLEDDGGVPVTPPAPWDDGVFRARPPRLELADLLVEIGDACVADCTYGPVELTVQVTNQGLADVAAGTELEILAIDASGDRVVATEVLPAIPAATRLDGIEIDLSPADVGELGFAAVVDPAGAVRECDETNDRDELRDAFCP